MRNTKIERFMESFDKVGLTFDDVSLLTAYSDFLPSDADIKSQFSRNIELNIPFVSAAMDTVTESNMAIALAQLGGIGVIHKNLPIEKQASEVHRVKYYLNGLISHPVVFHPEQTVDEMIEEKREKKYTFSGFPIVDKGNKLVGIVTRRDLKFVLAGKKLKLKDIMKKKLITAPQSTPLTEAFEIMMKHKIGKLPLIDDKGKLAGLYSHQDVRSIIEDINPIYNRDSEHRLRVAAAIGPYDMERATELVNSGCDALVIDTAHGHSKGVIDTVKLCKDSFNVDIVAGNVGTEEGARALLDAGADAVKVGIGPGSICTTRVVAGVGIPQITAVYKAVKGVKGKIPVIADGGIKQSGDIAKVVAVGASSVMMGSILAGTQESPGEKIYHKGRTYVIYRGMGSLEAMKENLSSRERYGVSDIEDIDKLVPQGIEGMVLFRGSVGDVIDQHVGGLRYSLGYCGAKTVQELQANAQLIRVTSAGLREAHPHDVRITKDAPNYSIE